MKIPLSNRLLACCGYVKPGDRVRHKVFGEGTITGIRGDIGCYVVKFDRVATERNLKIGVGLERV